jgi:hypothetical protein
MVLRGTLAQVHPVGLQTHVSRNREPRAPTPARRFLSGGRRNAQRQQEPRGPDSPP